MNLSEINNPFNDALTLLAIESERVLKESHPELYESNDSVDMVNDFISRHKNHGIDISTLSKGKSYSPISIKFLPVANYIISTESKDNKVVFLYPRDNSLHFLDSKDNIVTYPNKTILPQGDFTTLTLIYPNNKDLNQLLFKMNLAFSGWQYKRHKS